MTVPQTLEALHQELVSRAKRDGADISPNGAIRRSQDDPKLVWVVRHSWPGQTKAIESDVDQALGNFYGPMFDALRELETGLHRSKNPMVYAPGTRG